MATGNFLSHSELLDHVVCNNCGKESLGPIGSDICIKCGFDGGLKWANEERPEAATGDFDHDKALSLLDGKYYEKAKENSDK